MDYRICRTLLGSSGTRRLRNILKLECMLNRENKMNANARIEELHRRRHELLERRVRRHAPVAALDIELVMIRSELLALYDAGRPDPSRSFSAPAA